VTRSNSFYQISTANYVFLLMFTKQTPFHRASNCGL